LLVKKSKKSDLNKKTDFFFDFFKKIMIFSNPEPLCRGSNTRGVAKYSDFGPINGCISETVQDRR